MPLGILFWVVYVMAFVFSLWSNYDANQPLWFKRAGGSLILWVLVGMLGWATFGPVVRGR